MQEVTPAAPVFLTVKQAADYLSCAVSFIRNEFVYAHKVPFVRLGKRIVFHREDLDAYMAAKKAAA